MSDALEERVERALGTPVSAVESLGGGMIGDAYRVDLADGRRRVAKVGDTPLTVEDFMLRYLAEHSDLPVPTVHHASDDLLVLEYVEGTSEITPAVERDLADHLARLHDVTAPAVGFPRDTLDGPLEQPNPWTVSWIDFYREHRLERAAEGAREHGPLTGALAERLAALSTDLDGLLREPDRPALIHGDVWRTNVLARDGRVVAFLDPATYYAHPEIELSYVDWTDTGGDPFFDRYRDRRRIADGFFETRRDVYVLHPLLVHVRLFGEEYLEDLDRALERLGY
ncbi:MAG: fructosamine-3-kinase [Halobacteriales archaeon]|jgi:fructosamine-3-kinase